MYKLGDTVKVYEKPIYDPSLGAAHRVLVDVLVGRAPPDPYKLITLSTQKMVDEYNAKH